MVTRSPASFLAGVFLLVLLDRIYGFPLRMASSASNVSVPGKVPKRLLIVGGGIGGLSSAFDAKHILRTFDEITVVSDRELFQFTPSNPWVSTRFRTPEDISLSLKEILPRHKINFVHGQATHLDPKRQELQLHEGTKLSYDYLIVATGPRLAFDEIPGAVESSLSVCTTPHAFHTADKVDSLVQSPGPIVIGATQGSSCFGPAYEFAFLLHAALKKRGGQALLDQCPITFITSEPYIGHLGLKGAGESRKILEDMLSKSGIEFFTNCKVNRVAPDHVSVTQVDADPRNNKTIKLPSKFTMLIPPFQGIPVWKQVPGLTDEKGMIMLNDFQQSVKYPSIFGVGVSVAIPPVEKTLVSTGPPKTGYLIESQGTAAVKNIRTLIDHAEQNPDTPPPDLRFQPLLNGLCITDFGSSGAIFLTLPQYPPRRTDFTLHGKMATLVKIAFEKYFLHKIETGDTDPYYEKYMLHLIGDDRVTSKD